MIEAGFETTEPRTGTRTLVLQAAAETDGMGWVLEVTCPEGAQSSILEHVHTGWLETFEIVEGVARYKLDGREAEASKRDPIPAQRFLSATLGWISEALGYRAVYPRFVGDYKP